TPMTTTLRRWPRWAFAALLAAAGCGPPPPMVTMAPPGTGGDPLAVDITDDAYKAKALGETPRGSAGSADEAEATAETSPPLAPTEPGEEATLDSGLTYSTIEPGDPDAPMAEVGDSITVFYEGKLDDGTVFDSNMGK